MVSRSYVPAYLFLYVAAGLSMSCIYSKLAGYPSPIMPTTNWRMEKGTELPGSWGHRSHDYTVVLLVHPFMSLFLDADTSASVSVWPIPDWRPGREAGMNDVSHRTSAGSGTGLTRLNE